MEGFVLVNSVGCGFCECEQCGPETWRMNDSSDIRIRPFLAALRCGKTVIRKLPSYSHNGRGVTSIIYEQVYFLCEATK